MGFGVPGWRPSESAGRSARAARRSNGSSPVWHLYVVGTREREALATFLSERGIATGRHYPEPAHLAGAYASLGYRRGAFPVTERLADELLSLPIFPGMSDDEIESVVTAIKEFFADA